MILRYSSESLICLSQIQCTISISILGRFSPRVSHESIGGWMRQIYSGSDQRSFWLTSNAWSSLNIWRISKLVVSPGLFVVFGQIYCRDRIRNYCDCRWNNSQLIFSRHSSTRFSIIASTCVYVETNDDKSHSIIAADRNREIYCDRLGST